MKITIDSRQSTEPALNGRWFHRAFWEDGQHSGRTGDCHSREEAIRIACVQRDAIVASKSRDK